jgi:opacity protein-like surface antigen
MMRFGRLICIAAVLSSLFLLPASAQTITPRDEGSIAVGGDLGVLFPDESLESTFTWDGFAEYYVKPRLSIRGLFGWANPGFENRTEDKFRQFKLLFNGVYFWDQGKLHPFATAGAGFYFVRQLLEGADDPDSETRGGLNFGGGIDYSFNPQSAVRTELRWDIVSHPPGLPDATGITWVFGYKRFF